MRHRKKFNHLSRTRAHRRAMLANMGSSLILHKRINTTLAKAKALRSYIEPIITKSKNDTTHSRRIVFSMLQDKDAVNELFRDVSVKVAERPGGYTRILKIGNRLGDNAEMAMMELVDYNENLLAEKEEARGKSTRRGTGRRRGGKKKSTTEQSAEPKTQEAPKKEEPVKEEKTESKAEAKTEEKESPKSEAKDQEKEEPSAKAEEKKEEKKETPGAEKKEEAEEDKKEEDKK